MLSNLAVSAIRTYVPIGVGLLLTWIATLLHIGLDPSTEPGLAGLCVAVASALYWTLIRFLERKWPALGVLLGKAAQPAYPVPTATADATTTAQQFYRSK